jgi:hypothetical protein
MSMKTAIYSAMVYLEKGGYSIYLPPPTEGSFVIEDSRGVLSKVIWCPATSNGSTAVLNLNTDNQAHAYLKTFGFFLAVDIDRSKSWLIPVEAVPPHTKSIRLGNKFDSFIIEDNSLHSSLTAKTIQQEVKNRLNKSGKVSQENLEYLLKE